MDEEDLARHLASSKKWYTKLRKRAPLLGGDARMVEMRTEDLLALNRTAWRPYFQASLPAAVNAQNSSGPFPLTVGVKHVSDFVERRNAAGLKWPPPAPSACLVHPGAPTAPTYPRAPLEHLGSLRWPKELALGRPKAEDLPVLTSRQHTRRTHRERA